MFKRALLTVSAACLLSSAAGAVSVYTANGPYSGPTFTPTYTIDFESDALGSTDPNFVGGAVRQGTLGNSYAAPLGDTTQYYAVGPNSTPTASIALGSNIEKISLYWGSIDGYNSITFDGLGLTLTGDDITPPGNGDRTDPQKNLLVEFTLTAQESALLTGLTFTAKQDAFEFDNLAFQESGVPEPAAWMSMIAGFGLVGSAMRRRRANVAFA